MKKAMKLFALCAAVFTFGAALASCQKETVTPDEPEVHVFHVELDATVDDTKATYATASKQITFESGDALYVALTEPTSASWSAATGTLTYNGTSFTGDITYTGTYDGSDIITDAKDLSATFLPKDYDTVAYLSATGEVTATKAFYAGTKDAAVPQLVHLTASVSDRAGTSKSPLALTANNAVLFYTITANNLSAGAHHGVSVSNGNGITISGEVTATADNATTFAVAFPADATERAYTLSIPGYNDVVKSGKTLTAGKVANISTGLAENLSGVFSVSSTQTAKFAKGNLQATYNGSAWSWAFAEHQWDYIGSAAANTSINGNGTVSANGTVDLFGWSTSLTTYGIHDSGSRPTYYGAFVDWGTTIGTGWRTLTRTEWTYVFNTRTTGGTVFETSSARYTQATINTDGTSINGIILFPDGVDIASSEVTTAGTVNGTSDWGTQCTSAQWTALESKGCVFLPAAGYRDSNSVSSAGSQGTYWSSSPNDNGSSYPGRAYQMYFYSNNVNPAIPTASRYYGCSVRLVQNQ